MSVRDDDGGLPRPRGLFLYLTVVLKHEEYLKMRQSRLFDPSLVGATGTGLLQLYADDNFAWVVALTDPWIRERCTRHTRLFLPDTRWLRFSLLLRDSDLEGLLQSGALQGPHWPGRGEYLLTHPLPLGGLIWEIQYHVVVPTESEEHPAPREELFPGPWWVGRVARSRAMGNHFRPGVVDRALILPDVHPLRNCTLPRPLGHGDRSLAFHATRHQRQCALQ